MSKENYDVVFLHGLESSPNGSKARYLSSRYKAFTPALSTGHFPTALAQARETIAQYQPSVVIGSSYGGALLLALVTEGSWKGPCVFIAQAGVKFGVADVLPQGTRAILLHGTEDDVVPIEGSRQLAASGGADVELREIIGGDHRLECTLTDGRLAAAIDQLLTEKSERS